MAAIFQEVLNKLKGAHGLGQTNTCYI